MSKFIHIVRDPVANVNSFKSVPFDLDDVGCLAQRWKIYNSNIEKEKIRKPKSFLTIKFEDLVNYQDKSINKISSFLNIDRNKFYATGPSAQYANVYWHKNLAKDVDKKFYQKNTILSKKEVQIIENICNEKLKLYKYKHTEKKVIVFISIIIFYLLLLLLIYTLY